MPIQTELRNYMKIADGTKLSISLNDGVSYTDIGVVTGDVNATLEYEEVQEESANAGKSPLYAKNPTIAGAFDLQELNRDNISNLASGLMTKATTAGTPLATIVDQDIAAGWTDEGTYNLIMETSSTNSTNVKMATQPVLTSVTADPSGTPEVLVEDADYIIVESTSSTSGWAIAFMSANFDTASEGDLVTIVYDTNTPVARATYHIGSSIQELSPFNIKLEHTDSNSLSYGVEIYECYTKSGSIQWMFKSAAENGFNSMPFTFTGVLDSSRSDGYQLLNTWEDTGAE